MSMCALKKIMRFFHKKSMAKWTEYTLMKSTPGYKWNPATPYQKTFEKGF